LGASRGGDCALIRLTMEATSPLLISKIEINLMLHLALRHLRRFHGIKQQDLAQKLDISNSYLSEIESGVKAHAITVELLNKYSQIFDIPVSTLLLFSEQMETGKRSDRLRVVMAAKVLKILDWIDKQDESAAA
jgi:transcriptional regulator with XRE-family HTH domain